MKNVLKLTRRFVGILMASMVLLLLLNFIVLAVLLQNHAPKESPWDTANEAASALRKTETGYILSDELTEKLMEADIWAIFIEDGTQTVVWQTRDLPDSIPKEYSLSDIAALTSGYIDGFPTFTGECENGLMVLGYPKDSFWKLIRPTWEYSLIANMPKIALTVLAINLILLFLISFIADSRLLRSVKPFVGGIQALSSGEAVQIKEKGLLSEIAVNINEASRILQTQKEELQKKETARANWIAGVSHDIRTPLSMVMGYADQLEGSQNLPAEARKKAGIIVKQSSRIKSLITDLNLASKLEYNMQPLTRRPENAVAIVRQAAVDFINTDMEGRYPVEWQTNDGLSLCTVNADKDLLTRAVMNLIQNSMVHNETGCSIYISVAAREDQCVIRVEDDGIGASDEQIEKLNNLPHYMVCDTNTTEQRHGLGLLIVKQIMEAHGGTTAIGHSSYGGFSVELSLPILK